MLNLNLNLNLKKIKLNFNLKNILFIIIFISLGFLLFLFLDTNLTNKNYQLKEIKENYNDDNEDDFYLSNMRTRDYQDVISITESQIIDTNFLEKILKKNLKKNKIEIK